jgi:cyclic pyranopterin phosphate synthase
MPIRFIELMPVSRADLVASPVFYPIEELMRELGADGGLEPLPDYRPGHGPARYYRHGATGAKLGFIGALTTPHFCESCNKLRLTADGKLRPCLGRHGEIDLLASLRAGGDPARALEAAVANKPESHGFLESYLPERPMTAIGG